MNLNQVDARTALVSADVAGAIEAFNAVMNEALAAFIAAHPGEQARRDFMEEANETLARGGMRRWLGT